MKIHSFALILVGLVMLSSVSYAYTIEGNSVFIEDAQASLRVTPHTARYPTAEGYQQEFEVCNKTGTTVDLYGAYVFNYELQNAKAEYAIGEDENGFIWLNVTNSFEKKEIGNKFAYAYTSGKTVLANSCETWRITYKPNEADVTEKWDLWLWVGEEWTCILDSTCIKELKLDPWWSGVGSEADPFIITDCNQLQTMNSYTAHIHDDSMDEVYFELGNDIDCAGFDWTAIGVFATDYYFQGHIQGNNYSVSNLTVSTTTGALSATFIAMFSGEIENVAFIDFNSWITGANGSCLIGICSDDGNISKIYAQGGSRGGGNGYDVAGLLCQATINCTVKNSYVVDVSVLPKDDTIRVGGFVGLMTGDAKIINCYSNASVISNDADVGAFAGLKDAGTCTDNFWDSDTAIETDDACSGAGATGLTTANMFKQASFTNWDFTNVWTIEEDINYPTLIPAVVRVEITINKINNSLFSTHPIFNFGTTGNVIIDFNVYSADNNRLTVDLNYSQSTAQGSGTVIIKDLNLTSEYCSDQNFAAVSECSYSWNYSTVADGNYSIIGLTSNGTITDFDASDSTFEILNKTDLNITTINGLDYKTHPVFAYGIDENITIDFNVFNSDNRRLTIDLNYSQSTTQGSGTVIIKDLNLTSTYCTNQNFTTVSKCTYSWNYSELADGNYGIIGIITDSNGLTDFNTSDANFEIANDVNIVVLAPINENTGVVIPSRVVGSTIGYSVKITTEDTIKFYDDMIDLNGFSVAYQETPILITIDVNVADEYYPRQYSISFNEATSTYTIQPYLAPVADSGNFIFYVTNLTTTGPLADVTIIIDGVVPGADGVVIQEIVTDSAGTATIPLLLDTEYSITFYYDGVLVHTATIVPTAGSLTYQVGLDISAAIPPPPPIGSIQVKWTPTTGFLLQTSDGSIDINAQIWLHNKTVSTIQARVYDSNGCLYENSFFTALWTDGNTIDFQTDLNTGLALNIYTGLPCIFDTNTNIHSIFATIDINSTDGNRYYARSISWQVVQLNNYQWNLWYRLGITADALNPPGTKIISSIVSFFIVFIAVFAASKTVGNTFFTAMVGLVLLGFCVYFGWFDAVIFYFIVVGTMAYSLYSWGKLG